MASSSDAIQVVVEKMVMVDGELVAIALEEGGLVRADMAADVVGGEVEKAVEVRFD